MTHPTDALRLDESQRKAVERAAMDAGSDVWRHCRLAMVADGEVVGYPCFSRADMAELARLYEAAPALPLPEGGGDTDWQSVAMWMGFSASVIKSGEPWSDQCQQHYDEAKAAFARLAAPTGAK